MAKRPKGEHDSVRRRKMRERKQREEEGRPATKPLTGEVRLNRFIAQTGLCSRRTADEWIAAGRVSVNGKPVSDMGIKVDPDKDEVAIDGRPVQPQNLIYVLLNKPKDAITTTSDERDRRTVMDLLDDVARRRGVVPVGRLDRNTTGALLLTNDGELTHRLMHPRYEVEKLYKVETESAVSDAQLRQLLEGIELEDGPAKADQVTHLDAPNVVGLSIHEGRNRQVRRMFEALGHTIKKLDRMQYAGLTVGNLARGESRLLDLHEVNRLRRSVKLKPLVF